MTVLWPRTFSAVKKSTINIYVHPISSIRSRYSRTTKIQIRNNYRVTHVTWNRFSWLGLPILPGQVQSWQNWLISWEIWRNSQRKTKHSLKPCESPCVQEGAAAAGDPFSHKILTGWQSFNYLAKRNACWWLPDCPDWARIYIRPLGPTRPSQKKTGICPPRATQLE